MLPGVVASDRELLERWRAGDGVNGEALFERYYGMVERFFRNKVTGSVEDLVQETFMRCLESRERIKDDDRFRTYMFSIAYNVLCAYLRERYRSDRAIDLNEISVLDVAPGPSSLIAQRREHGLLIEALRSIAVEDQVILELHYWEQLTTHEMAQVIGVPLGTARGRLQRARVKLEDAMQRLAENPEHLVSTLARLDDWVAECREHMGRLRGEAPGA
jgi:RNA polymerase sigma-70 factor (ECF subfamily)